MNVTSMYELASQVIRDWQRMAADARREADGVAPESGAQPATGAPDHSVESWCQRPSDQDDVFRPSDFFERVVGDGSDWLADVLTSHAAGARPATAERILAEAYTMHSSADVSAAFAVSASYSSVNPCITGRCVNQPKCNVFAGDVLWSAGFEVPTYDMTTRDSRGRVGQHYKEAERWPKESAFFDKVTQLDDVRPGDLLIVDYAGRQGSGGGAHVEVITQVQGPGDVRFTSIGARGMGLREDGFHARKLLAAEQQGDHWSLAGDGKQLAADLYVLRPSRHRVEGATRDPPVRAGAAPQ